MAATASMSMMASSRKLKTILLVSLYSSSYTPKHQKHAPQKAEETGDLNQDEDGNQPCCRVLSPLPQQRLSPKPCSFPLRQFPGHDVQADKVVANEKDSKAEYDRYYDDKDENA